MGQGSRRRLGLLLAEVVLQLASFAVFTKHFGGRVDAIAALLCQPGEVLIVDVAFGSFVEVVKDEHDVLGGELDLQCLHPDNKLVKADSVIEIHIKPAERRAKVLEALLDADPDTGQDVSKMHFVLLQYFLLSCGLALHIRGEDVVDRRRWRLVEDPIVLWQVDIQVREVAEFIKINYAFIADANQIECFILSTADKVLNDAVVVFGTDAAELRYRDRVLRSELG